MALTHSEIIFARDLDHKLQDIQDQSTVFIHNDLYKKKNMNKCNRNRPQFITTVKKGVFLEPPPEVASLLGLSPVKSSVTTPMSESPSSTSTHPATVVMYSYASRPKVLHKNYHTDCSRHRGDDGDGGPYGNLMYDRRIVRGTTYATNNNNMPQWNPNFGYAKLLSQSHDNKDEQARQREARRRAQARRKARVHSSRARQGMVTPPPVTGRKHEPVQTERYLEELLDRPPEAEVSCQTDLYLERARSPMYIPSAGGEEKETQIYPGELFDFDVEVSPLVENLIHTAMEQGLAEVLEEDELLEIQVQQRRLQEIHALEDHQQRRLSDSDISLIKHSLLMPIPPPSSMDQVPTIMDILPSVLEKLQTEGVISRPQDVDEHWLLDWISARVASPDVIEDFVREALRFVGQIRDTSEAGKEENSEEHKPSDSS